MVDIAKKIFCKNNFSLAAYIYQRIIRENGPSAELYLGLGDSFARKGLIAEAFQSYANAYRFGNVTPEDLKHLVSGLIDSVKQNTTNIGPVQVQKNSKFACGLCQNLLVDPITLACGHTFCKKCIDNDEFKACCVCGVVQYKLKLCHLSTNVVLANLIEKLFPDECKASRLKSQGNEYFTAQDYSRAIEIYSKALDIDKTDHILLTKRSNAYALMDQFQEALIDAEKVMIVCPDFPEGYYHQGCALYGLGRYEDAAVSFLKCLALDETMASAKEFLSKTLNKILSALPSHDSKGHAVQQKRSSTLFQRLIENNFSQPILESHNVFTLSDVAETARDSGDVCGRFLGDPTQDELFDKSMDSGSDMSGLPHKYKRTISVQPNNVKSHFTQKLRSPSLPDCSDISHAEIHKIIPRSYSPPLPSRKQLGHSTASPCRVSPSYTSLKVSISDSGVSGHERPAQISTEDLECGLCYRLFYEPVTTPCGHTFCRKCLDRCLDHTVTCPICKGNLAEYLAERRQVVTDLIQNIIKTYFAEAYAERCSVNEEEMTELTRMGSDHQSDIPVFVCILAFPTVACPLHVFEPRYRLMMRQCVESGTRQFGMCLHTGDSDDDFSAYGCMLEIRDVQYFRDGRSVVDTIGGRRFKVLSRGKRDGYNTAKVEFISDSFISDEGLQVVNSMQSEIHAMMKNWFSRLPSFLRTRINQHFGELPGVDLNPNLSTNGPAWVWWAVAVLPMDPRLQVTMLAMSSFQDRLIALKKVLTDMNHRGSR